MKPFNFLIAATVLHGAFGVPDGCDPNRFRLIRPYEADAREWERGWWTNLHDGRRFRVALDEAGGSRADTARVQTYRDVLDAYRYHPERKSVGPDGQPCGKQTIGLLGRRAVRAGRALVIGKEAHRLDDVGAQWEGASDALTWDTGDAGVWRDAVLPVLRAVPAAALASAALSPRRLRDVLAGRALPHAPARAALTALAGAQARTSLARAGRAMPPRSGLPNVAYDAACCVATGGLVPSPLVCAGCGTPFRPRRAGQRHCSVGCRQRAHRRGAGAG